MRLDLSTGEQIADPDDQAVERALWSVGQEQEFAILIADERDERHYIQVAKESEGFVVEYREAKRQYRSDPVPLDTAVKTFRTYRNQDSSWKRGISWTEVTDEIGSKSGCQAQVMLLVMLVCAGVGAVCRLLI